jgi:hypothetical protein
MHVWRTVVFFISQNIWMFVHHIMCRKYTNDKRVKTLLDGSTHTLKQSKTYVTCFYFTKQNYVTEHTSASKYCNGQNLHLTLIPITIFHTMLRSLLFWDIVWHKLVVGYRYFGTNILSQNIWNLPTYTAQFPRRSKASTTPWWKPEIFFLVRNGRYLTELKKTPSMQ